MSDRNRFDKFTEHARKVLSQAQEEAQRIQHNYIGTEHLLLGLLHEEQSVAVTVLENLGAESSKVRSAVELAIGRGYRSTLGQIGLTPRAKKVIELAVDEARRLNHHYIGTEHILLGLVREGEGIAGGALASLGVTLERARAETVRILKQAGQPIEESQEEAAPAATDNPPEQVLLQIRSNKPFDGHPFTDQAHRIIEQAHKEAEHFQHNYIGTEHLLLGMVHDGEGVAGAVLRNLGVQLSKVRDAVEFIIGRGDRIVLGEIGLTPRAKKVIELAVDESRHLNNNYVGTEHLLLGMVREGEGIAAGVLESLGVTLDKVRAQTMRVLEHAKPEEPNEA